MTADSIVTKRHPTLEKDENDEFLESTTSTPLFSSEHPEPDLDLDAVPERDFKPTPYKRELVWRNIIALLVMHIIGIYAFCLIPSAKLWTMWWGYAVLLLATVGVQTGAHRLWAHRCYKAHWSLRLVLSLLHVMALQNDLYEWCRDHRVHHKWSDTDADPHNSSRGFFFSHMGWLMVRKHPEVIRKGKTVDLSDLKADPIVMFQRRFYVPLVFLFWGYLPAAVPVYCWNETWFHSIFGVVILRYVLSLNVTWLVNSWAHMYGTRPYDKKAVPVEASIRNWLMGEGFHNYHHTFPWDYSASELGAWDVFNPGTVMIDFYQKVGLAWDLKKVSPQLIAAKYKTTGD
ncbi:PREDICTED: acyl-CoA desaturase-like, partial [Rhagoletis zephyria]|uniref:acyl-CoA desaturase-like n=1 Tax=Rhagoletis zephyria TaxID=28612 RepID=UPI00081131A7